ncbi:hypothetical protein CPB86DRAFT_90193 [Serendipita vermifera]|nr:hypothetical protein CPB86DRAFT_90193 [Serendipita vermifera]
MPQDTGESANPFDKLPEEIVEVIGDYINTGHYMDAKQNVSSFASCDRRLRRIVHPILYRDIRLFTSTRIYRFFQHLLDFPQHASDVRTILLICYYDNIWHSFYDRDALDKGDMSRIVHEAHTLSLPVDIISRAEQKVDWAVALCLLPLLTNLKGFQLEPGDTHLDDFNNYSAQIFIPRYLSPSLRWVYLGVDGWDWTPSAVDLLIPFFQFPSITEISARQVESKTRAIDSHLLIPSALRNADAYNQSGVRALRLYSCRISESALTILLRLPVALKSFVFSNQSGYRSLISLSQFQRAIDLVSDTLDTLVLQFDDRLLESAQAWSFSHFKVLKKLSVSCKLLFSRRTGDIIDQLPPSLETLVLRVLHAPISDDIAISDYVRNLLTRKSSMVLPHFKTIAVNDQRFDWTQFVDLAAARGIRIGQHDLVIDR